MGKAEQATRRHDTSTTYVIYSSGSIQLSAELVWPPIDNDITRLDKCNHTIADL